MSAIFGTLPIAVPATKLVRRIGVTPAAMLTKTKGALGASRTIALATSPLRPTKVMKSRNTSPPKSRSSPVPKRRPKRMPKIADTMLPTKL